MLTKENLLAAWEQLQSDNALNRPGCSSKLSTLAITLKGHVATSADYPPCSAPGAIPVSCPHVLNLA